MTALINLSISRQGRPLLCLLGLLLICGVSIYLGLFTFDTLESLNLYRLGAYWSLTLTFGLFIFFLIRSLLEDRRQGRFAWPRKSVWITGLVTVLLATLFTMREEEPGFHMVMDDFVIASTSQQMHLERKFEVPVRMAYLGEERAVLHSLIDKRPGFVAYLGSVVSDVTGFRPRNTIYLNMAMAPVLYALLFAFGYRLGGTLSGIASVALMTSIPWLIFLTHGGGMETMNLVMIVTTMILCARFLEKPNNDRLGAFCMSSLLLAQTRYESILFILVTALAVLLWWIRDRKLQIPWVLFLCPPLLMPYLLQYRSFDHEASWQMFSVDRGESPFGPQYFSDNLVQALHFFFSWDNDMGNSILLGLAGVVALIALMVLGLKRVKSFFEAPVYIQALILWIPGFIAVFVLLLLYGWEFDAPIIRRLALPMFIPLAFACGLFYFRIIASRAAHKVFLGILAFYYLFIAFPYSSLGEYRNLNIGPQELAVFEKFVNEEIGDQRAYFVSETPFLFILHGKEATHIKDANSRPEAVKYFLAQPGNPPLYATSRYKLNTYTLEYVPSAPIWLDEDIFELEPVLDERYSLNRAVRIDRIVGVKDSIEMPQPEEPLTTDEKYINFWVNHLP